MPDNKAAEARTRLRIRLLLLLAVGIALWGGVVAAGQMAFPVAAGTVRELELVGLAAGLFLIPPLRRRMEAGLRRLRHPTPRQRAWTSLIVAVVAGAYLLATAIGQARDFFPKFHDEYMNLVQMQLLAHGRLWLPAHPQADFFETFHIFVKPVYAPIHFPGTALLYAPAVWLRAPHWLFPLMTAAACVGLIYRVMAEMIDGVAGLLAALLMLGLRQFRFLSLMVMSNSVALLLGLTMVWAFMRWGKSGRHRARWALVIGILAGWLAITRPPDALSFILPLAAAMAWELRAGWRKWLVNGLALVAGATPFLAMQLIFDRGVTGSYWESPHDLYSQQYNPGVNYGVREPDWSKRPQTTLLQKKEYYAWFVAPYIFMHRPGNLWNLTLHAWFPEAVNGMLPAAGLLLFLPAGLLGLTDRRRIALAAVLPLGLGFYVLSVMIASYYLLFAAPAVLLLVLLGMRQFERAWPRHRSTIQTALALLVAATTLATLPELCGGSPDQLSRPTLKAVEEQLATIRGRALVLFTYRKGDNFHEEPVYNIDAPWPDDQRIVRAQDLGNRNGELLDYYARLQPDRMVYRFDRQARKLELLGNVADLARRGAEHSAVHGQ